jgi:hypothetical protein
MYEYIPTGRGEIGRPTLMKMERSWKGYILLLLKMVTTAKR